MTDSASIPSNNLPGASPPAVVRRRLTVTGVVQGVGFRPFVYGLALRHQLGGFVGNNSSGVFIEVEGLEGNLAAFQAALIREAPPLAHIETVAVESLEPTGDGAFGIVHSQAQAAANTLVSPDICICADCLRELLDPEDRRYRYPFINCTNCGPRFTIIRDIPYDRPATTMASFAMCAACQAEYEDPLNRRFHAQPNACPDCGPRVWLEWTSGADRARLDMPPYPDLMDPIVQTQHLLAQGAIIAVKGLGGFHLACDASQDDALATLRERKGRVDKPFAVMAVDLASVQAIAHASEEEIALLTSKERPIVLLRKRADSPLSELVAPGNPFVGVMLPYTPLHVLLFEGREPSSDITERHQPLSHSPFATPAHAPERSAGASVRHSPVLVMTSGNYSDEPIVKDNEEARERLGGLADALLLHDRNIHVWCDDSVTRVFQGTELPIRRSRGYTPFPVPLPVAIPPTLAVGGELKATFCLVKGRHAFLSQHIGDMENLETLQAFQQAVDHFSSLFRVEPERVVADLHPGYLSTRWAQRHAANHRLVYVQHHHAHLAALMAEHGLDSSETVVGFSFDGTGYGTDGAIWGGEVMIARYEGFQRIGHLKYIPLPGGDAAIKRPYRVALSHLWAAQEAWDVALPPVGACPPEEQRVLRRQLETGLNTVPTSSMGRLFDAVAALAGVRQAITYEAQAAIELESLAEVGADGVYAFHLPPVVYYGDPVEFDAAPVIQAVARDVRAGVPTGIIASRFHQAVADLILEICRQVWEQQGLFRVALSGGVFQNVTLLELVRERLQGSGFEVLTHRQVPPNDGGLALGQAIVGGLMP